MTTTAAVSESVDLTAGQNGQAPKRRGRPPGSKNKAKSETATATPKRRGRPKKTTTRAARKTTTTPRARKATTTHVETAQPTLSSNNHAILIEKDGLVVIGNDGSSYRINAPVIVDRRV